MKRYAIIVLGIIVSASAHSQSPKASWLPDAPCSQSGVRMLGCRYDGPKLAVSDEITADSPDWEVTVSVDSHVREGEKPLTAYDYSLVFRAKRPLESSGVAVSFDRAGWSSDNYLMIPSSVYNGNRQRIVNRPYGTGLDKSDYGRPDLALTSNPIPQLSPDFGSESRLEVLVCNASTPAIVWLERVRHKAYILLTEQGIERDGLVFDNGLIVEESRDRSYSSIVVSAPGVRSKKPEFVGFCESPDRGLSFSKGDSVEIRARLYEFDADSVPEVLNIFYMVRKDLTGANSPRNIMPESQVLKLMTADIDRRYYVSPEWEYYCPENADWISIGWIGGLMNTYPMLALGDEEHFQKVLNTFDFAFPRAQGKSGFFYGSLGSDGKVFAREGAGPDPAVCLTRKNADALYWIEKQFILLQDQGRYDRISPEWTDSIHRLADAFVTTWRRYGSLGKYVNVETGEIVEYNTNGGVMACAALALASRFFGDGTYLEVAEEMCEAHYAEFMVRGFTSGACGDILQNADSETSVALLTSCNLLYEMTSDRRWLKMAEDAAALCSTWTVSFDYRLPEDTDLARLGAHLAGAVWASTQNKHGAPGFCTTSADAFFRLYRETGNELYAELIRDVIHAHAEGIHPNGRIIERLTYCDANMRGDRGDGNDSTGWNELAGAMMALEIPGIYVRTDEDRIYVFDHVEARIVRSDNKKTVLSITNPTPFDASVSLLAENAADVSTPLPPVAFTGWRKIAVKSGETVSCVIRK